MLNDRPRVQRRIAIAAGLVVLGAILIYAVGKAGSTEFRLDEFTLTEGPPAAAAPVVDEIAAGQAALHRLSELDGSVQGLVLLDGHLARRLTAISDATGSLEFSTTDAADCWVLVYGAPQQNGFRTVKALVVVDASTGNVSSAQLLQSN